MPFGIFGRMHPLWQEYWKKDAKRRWSEAQKRSELSKGLAAVSQYDRCVSLSRAKTAEYRHVSYSLCQRARQCGGNSIAICRHISCARETDRLPRGWIRLYILHFAPTCPKTTHMCAPWPPFFAASLRGSTGISTNSVPLWGTLIRSIPWLAHVSDCRPSHGDR